MCVCVCVWYFHIKVVPTEDTYSCILTVNMKILSFSNKDHI